MRIRPQISPAPPPEPSGHSRKERPAMPMCHSVPRELSLVRADRLLSGLRLRGGLRARGHVLHLHGRLPRRGARQLPAAPAAAAALCPQAPQPALAQAIFSLSSASKKQTGLPGVQHCKLAHAWPRSRFGWAKDVMQDGPSATVVLRFDDTIDSASRKRAPSPPRPRPTEIDIASGDRRSVEDQPRALPSYCNGTPANGCDQFPSAPSSRRLSHVATGDPIDNAAKNHKFPEAGNRTSGIVLVTASR